MKNFYKSVLVMLMLTGSFVAKSQVPELNSYSSAPPVIFLDFDGQYISGTMWNTSGPFTCNPSGLNNSQITEVFNRVAEDFRPFNINITTSQTSFNAAPFNRRIRVVITTSNDWYGSGAGGVAFISSFTWGDDTPCFVFSALQAFNTKNIAEAVSHEAGHTLGLRHQSSYNSSCVKLSDYNWGIGTGEIGWAPIMGASYNQNMSLWNSGPNSLGCSVIQNDLNIITSVTNGFGFRTDDHSDQFASATNSVFDTNNQFIINGVIEKSDDKDLFKFTMPVFGRLQLSAIPYNVGSGNSGSDLDLQVEFLDGSNAVIGTYNPGNLLSSVIDSFVNAGTYYLRIDGKGNIYAPEYGSLGSYSLQATFTDASLLPLRKLELRGQLNGDNHLLTWTIEASERITKQILEVSTNGINYTPLDQPDNNTRNFSYHPFDNKPLLYRLHVTFENQKEYYSNVIAIRQGKNIKPELIGNTITGNLLSVNSPGNFQYHIVDQSGRLLVKGKLETGFYSINIGSTRRGIYIIRFTDGIEQWSEKFFKN